ncbi:hypothetical protein GCM10022223_32370 [Kineosporia mesophila]|uniref:Uncharacterized protein n=1 Tax=Kineosporia mesophila TaxID=566012 RepID=A0ABP6ZPR7_9ACTN|nr:hypothetical protein [Kineosporia mesophila]MCD5354437.1 hypothetical protein [Kineosporia mesophila]
MFGKGGWINNLGSITARSSSQDASDQRGFTAAHRVRAVSQPVAAARDRVAASPLPDTGSGRPYGRPEEATYAPAPLLLPADDGSSIAGVQSGYPPTQEGALAQLASIEIAVIRSASTTGIRAIIAQWTAPGGPTASTWAWTATMTELLADFDAPATGSANVAMSAEPSMGLLKNAAAQAVGEDWAVPCLDMTVDIVRGNQNTQITIADCQRMVWDGTRWLIAAGAEPAVPPAAPWPSTDAAYEAGYRDLGSTSPRSLSSP